MVSETNSNFSTKLFSIFPFNVFKRECFPFALIGPRYRETLLDGSSGQKITMSLSGLGALLPCPWEGLGSALGRGMEAEWRQRTVRWQVNVEELSEWLRRRAGLLKALKQPGAQVHRVLLQAEWMQPAAAQSARASLEDIDTPSRQADPCNSNPMLPPRQQALDQTKTFKLLSKWTWRVQDGT